MCVCVLAETPGAQQPSLVGVRGVGAAERPHLQTQQDLGGKTQTHHNHKHITITITITNTISFIGPACASQTRSLTPSGVSSVTTGSTPVTHSVRLKSPALFQQCAAITTLNSLTLKVLFVYIYVTFRNIEMMS